MSNMLQAKKQAEQRINSQFIMYVHGIHDLALKNTQRGRRDGNSAESEKHKKVRNCLGSAKKQNYGTIVEGCLVDEQYQKHMHEQRHTQSDMEKFDRTANENRILRRFIYRAGLLQRPKTRSYNSTKEEAATP